MASTNGQVFSDLTIHNVTFSSDTTTTYDYVGALIGNAGSNAITISNCHVTGLINLNGSYETGTFYGIGKVSVSSSSVNGEDGSFISADYHAGGLAGCVRGPVEVNNSAVSGVDIIAPTAGGIIGLENNTGLSISSGSISNVHVTGTGYAGSVVGKGLNTTISNVNIADDVSVTENDVIVTKFNGAAVAKIGDTEYVTLQEAIEAAYNGGTVDLLTDITVDSWQQNLQQTRESGQGPTGLTINGNNHSLTVSDITTKNNGVALLSKPTDLIVKDLIINLYGDKTNGNTGPVAFQFALSNGNASFDNVTFNGGRFALNLDRATGNITIKNS